MQVIVHVFGGEPLDPKAFLEPIAYPFTKARLIQIIVFLPGRFAPSALGFFCHGDDTKVLHLIATFRQPGQVSVELVPIKIRVVLFNLVDRCRLLHTGRRIHVFGNVFQCAKVLVAEPLGLLQSNPLRLLVIRVH